MYEVIDNFLPLEIFEEIKSHFFCSSPEDIHEKIKFEFQDKIVSDKDTDYEGFNWMHVHSFLTDDPLAVTKKSQGYKWIKPIIDHIESKFPNLNEKTLWDCRANILDPTEQHIQHLFHRDRNQDHIVVLFYMTTTNGFTILKDLDKVDCVENRILIFSGEIEHCSVTSTDILRCVVNFNYGTSSY